MIVTIHQPEHLPWLGYFHKMALADQYVFLDSTQYRPRYFQNRNRLHGVQEPIWVTVPVQKRQERFGLISEQLVDNTQRWRQTYWRSIEYNYRRHPHFDRYADDLKAIILAPFESLADLNYALIDFFRSALRIETPLIRSSALAVSGLKSDLIHAICVAMRATVYLSGPSGRDYLQEEDFRRSGIEVCYHDFRHPVYPQHGRKQFTPFLSALDLLMNCGPSSLEILGLDEMQSEYKRHLGAVLV